VATWSEQTLSALRAAGYRGGGARRSVVEHVGAQPCCRSAQEIHAGISAAGGRVGIASVYRVLDSLADLRLVQRVDIGDGIARYEPAYPGGDHHHHLVCDDCGKVEPFEDERLEAALDRVAGRLGYDVAGHDVVLRGACDDCR
jgi:Fur family ferric uptake transcriptional regulator